MANMDEVGTDQVSHDVPARSAEVSRRAMLRGVTVGGVALPLLAACGGGDDPGSAGSSSSSSSSSGAASGSASESAKAPAAGSGGTTVAAADVPVGSGVILEDEKLVVTQPTQGEFKAFTAVCTHQGCVLSTFVKDKVHCNCHGSEFSIADGKNVTGPNGSEAGSVADLEVKNVSVEGDQLSVG